jgi:hypothetical protein
MGELPSILIVQFHEITIPWKYQFQFHEIHMIPHDHLWGNVSNLAILLVSKIHYDTCQGLISWEICSSERLSWCYPKSHSKKVSEPEHHWHCNTCSSIQHEIVVWRSLCIIWTCELSRMSYVEMTNWRSIPKDLAMTGYKVNIPWKEMNIIQYTLEEKPKINSF